MALATAMVNSPDVFQCLASASLTVDWASAGSDRARNNSRFVFMVCLGTISHTAERAVGANGRGGNISHVPGTKRSLAVSLFQAAQGRLHSQTNGHPLRRDFGATGNCRLCPSRWAQLRLQMAHGTREPRPGRAASQR